MAADLGGSQISALLESVPGIANVLRSPVADAIVNMIRAGAGVGPFQREDADELVQYAVRRGLIGGHEGDEVLADIKGAGRGRGAHGIAPKTRAKTPKKPPKKKPRPVPQARPVKKAPARAKKR